MKKILANWYYQRPDLTRHLLELTDEAEIVFIDQFAPSQDRKEPEYLQRENISITYWGDYKSPYELLDSIKPDLVLFYDIEAFSQIALNIAAKNRGIVTYVLQHGLRGGYEVNDALVYGSQGSVTLSDTSFQTFRFLLRALRFKNLTQLYSLAKFIISRKMNELTVALYNNRFELRLADKYIEFSKENATYHKVRDGVPDNRFILIGNPGYDDFFQRIQFIPTNEKSPYALLLDSPFCEAGFVQKDRMSQQEKNDYLRRLNLTCKAKRLKLFIKLHPLSYQTEDLYQDDNVVYFKEADIVELIGGASLVFLLHMSTLAPLALYKKPFFYFKNRYIETPAFISSLNIETPDLLSFNPEKLASLQPSSMAMESVNEYLFQTDGKAGCRLRHILLT